MKHQFDGAGRAVKDGQMAWGKLHPYGSFHPLEAHMLDVAACFSTVAKVESVSRALARTAGRALTDVDWARLGALAFLHDVGKANAGFQAKKWRLASQPSPRGWPAAAGHVAEALKIFESEQLLAHLPVEEMSKWGASCLSLWRASISHHGRPVQDSQAIDHRVWQPVLTEGLVSYDPTKTLARIGECIRKWFPLAFQSNAPLPNEPAFEHLFAGLVQFADWLGSDTRFFPFAEDGEDRNQWVWQRAEEAVRCIGMNATSWREHLPKLPEFSQVFGVSSARPIQAQMVTPALGNLLILESETGSGKTEAALWRFAHLFQSGEVDALYFALPTRVAATQLYERTRKFAAGLWPSDKCDTPMVVRALAGYESADGHAITKLPNFEVLWADSPDDQKAHTRWAAESSKRFLAAPVAVGTVDQALMAALQVRHAHMRHSLLSRSLLVVDEVHASDAYMATLLAHLLKAHINAGGHALLLSATLGASARYRYQRLSAPELTMPSLAEAITSPYPALTDGKTMQALPDSGRSKRVHWQVEDCIDNPESIARLALDAAKQGAKVLVIRNTVPSALATFQAIETLAPTYGLEDALFNVNGVATVHHSRYSREDRPLLDAAVEQQIGKQRAKALKARIVVGTQTLEQSLDIDADLLITDLCPMDVLLQRVGRLHRHDRPDEERPEPCRKARSVVLVPAGAGLAECLKRARHGLGRFHNGGGIYADLRVLEATRRLIAGADSHLIPQDNRELVERATHPQVLHALAQELGAEWLAHGQSVDGETHAERVQANLNVLPFGQRFMTVDDNGYELDTLCFPDKEQKISSRLGAADYLLSFDPPQPGPFATLTNSIPVRHHLWPKDTPPDTQAVIGETLPGGGFTFTVGTASFRYSRLGLERIKQTSEGAKT